MATFDISRVAFQPRKHYAGVRMQQGRVLTDDDWNENERIENEERRRSNTDIIGPFGSPDKGFRIENFQVDAGGIFDFDIHSGTLYIGGLRLEIEAGEDNVYETFRSQKDWLQQPNTEGQAPGDLPSEERFDLVYLKAWQQGVSAVEDEELFEVGLGGPDTTTRVRNMRRVMIKADIGSGDCTEAWQALQQDWRDRHLGNMHKHELIPDLRLTVSYADAGEKDDLCSPAIAGGYLGAENQAIRVQLTAPDRFTWGFDDAAPLYRVTVSADGSTVTMLTEPKDQDHWPLSGQVVEILPWSAVLSNGQKVAGQHGHLSSVEKSFDPDPGKKLFTLQTPLPATFGAEWKNRADHAELAQPAEYFFLRVWNRGTDLNSDPELSFTPGVAETLGNTGIRITIDGNDPSSGNYWVIAARPETPNQVVPWALETGIPPQGARCFYAPLAIIRWAKNDAGEISGEIIHDCRKTFRPLTDLESCCTFHVGDGIHSFGDFDSIEEALQNLPDAGGKICVLPGEHKANITIINRKNVCICGCGERSIVIPNQDRFVEPIVRIASSQNICLEKLNLAHPGGIAVILYDRDPELLPSSDIRISNNRILALLFGIYIEVIDTIRGKNNIYIGHNKMAMVDKEDGNVAIFCLADEVLVERNKIVVLQAPDPRNPVDPRDGKEQPGGVFDPCADGRSSVYKKDFDLTTYLQKINGYIRALDSLPAGSAYLTLSGIQIGGGSEFVRIIGNEIIGGAGNGITFGHFPHIETNLDDYKKAMRKAMTTSYLSARSIPEVYRERVLTEFRSFLYEISVEGNQIQSMGLSGIGVIAFFDEEAKDDGLMVQVENLTIYRNIITQCALTIPQEIPDQAGYGGIALSSCEIARIEENRIENNGVSYIDPICGIYLLNGEEIEISHNRIINNGPRTSIAGENFGLSAQARRGIRGGIYIGLSFKRQFVEAILDELLSDGIPAAKIHGNIVVQPLGQSLFLFAFGPVSVVGNQFTSHEIDFGHPLSVIAGAVFIFNMGISKDLLRMAITPALLKLARLKAVQENNPQVIAAVQLALLLLQYLPSGNVLFSNNQTTLDLRNLEIDFSLCSQLIASLDDVAFSNNQAECKGLAFARSDRETLELQPIDIVLFNTVLAGVTVRTSDNRFQEGFTFVLYSLLSFGYFNTTVGNQSSNCLLDFGAQLRFDNNLEQFLGLQQCGQEKEKYGRSLNMDQPFQAKFAVNRNPHGI
jgi:hypothetical protein